MRYLNLWVLLVCIAVCLGINLLMGKDMNPDMLAYHVYSAHMLWTGGYREEFMGAGLQSFFNPVGYLPFYWMLKAGWPSLAIASCMAAVHAMNLFMVWLICRNFLFRESSHRFALSSMGVLLAAISPVFIAMLGGSFLDPVQSAIMLCGLYLVMRALSEEPRRTDLLIAGLLLGAATGLKPTVAATPIFAWVALTLVSWKADSAQIALRRAMMFGTSIAAGGLLTGGFWAVHLWQRFRSPVFPFANDVFKAPDFFSVPLTTDRFIPHDVFEVLSFPFRMAKINSNIYVEISAPDLRFALLVLVLVALLLMRLKSRKQSASETTSLPFNAPLQLLWIVFTAAVVLWMAKLGNGRYHLTYLLLVGPLLLWALARLFEDRKLTVMVAGLITVAQIAHGMTMGFPRWESASWTESWVKTWWPKEIEFKPATFLQLGPGIETIVFADFPQGSRFVDLGGKFPVSPNSPPARRIKDILLDTSRTRHVVFKSRASDDKDWQLPRQLGDDSQAQINHLLAPWDLRLADGLCHPMEVELDKDEVRDGTGKKHNLGSRRYALLICTVTSGSIANAQVESERKSLTDVAEVLTQTCPKLFPAPASMPTQLAGIWNIRYIGTDIVVALHEGQLTYSKYPHGPFNADIAFNPITGKPEVNCVAAKRLW